MELESQTTYLLDGVEYRYIELRGAQRFGDEDGALYEVLSDGSDDIDVSYYVKDGKLINPIAGLVAADVDGLTHAH